MRLFQLLTFNLSSSSEASAMVDSSSEASAMVDSSSEASAKEDYLLSSK